MGGSVFVVTDCAATADLVRGIIGQRLVAVTEARFWYEGKRDGDVDSLIHFWLHFQDAPPLMAHGRGEHLLLEFSEPYASYDMQEQGETRVGPAQAPDLLAAFTGQRLLDAALIQGYTLEPSVGGVQLRFESDDLTVASYCDEWLLVRGSIPPRYEYLAAGHWLARCDCIASSPQDDPENARNDHQDVDMSRRHNPR